MAHIFQVGVGSGGIVVLDLVARDPRVRKVTIIDPDVYTSHNVVRHLFPQRDVGRLKVDCAADWLRERRPELIVERHAVDLCAPESQELILKVIADCDLGICAVDNETAKYHFDSLFQMAAKPWTLGEVLAGGIGGFVHRFDKSGACYGCVASQLKRLMPDQSKPRPGDYANPHAELAQTQIPASRAAIHLIASLHAQVTLGYLDMQRPNWPWSSLLLTMQQVPDVFEEAYSSYPLKMDKMLSCLLCSAVTPPAEVEDIDAALNQALARLGHE